MKIIDFKKFLKYSAAFVVGLTGAAIFGFKLCFVPLILFSVVFLISIFFKNKINIKDFSFLSLFAIFGAFWFSLNVFLTYNFSEKFDGEEEIVVGTLKDIEYYENGRSDYILNVKKIGDSRVFFPFNLRLYVNKKNEVDCNYFDEIKVKVKLKSCVKNRWFNFFDSSCSKKIFLSGKVLSKIEVFEKDSFFANFLNLRDAMIKNIDFFVAEPYNFLASGIIFGRTRNIPFEIDRISSRCGVSHIFAISGLHICILSVFLVLILRFFRAPKLFCLIFLAVFMFIYAFVVGFSASVLRAIFMSLSVCFSMFLNKKIKPVEALLLSAFFILVIWPMSILGISFVLSFSSCFGIMFLSNKISNFIVYRFRISNKFIILVLQAFSVSLAATISTAAFLMFIFGKISIVAPISNLFVVPFLPILYIFSVLVSFFGFFSDSAAFFIGDFCEGLFGSIFYILRFISKFPFCYIAANHILVRIIVVLASLLFVIYLCIYKKYRVSKKFVFGFVLFILLLFFISLIFKKDVTRIYVLKSGYTTSVVINSCGKTVVVNCGGGETFAKKLVDFLDSKGILKVDIFVLASSKKRHMSGVVDFINATNPTCFVVSKDAQNSNILDYIDLDKTNIILNNKFYLEYHPVSINVLNDGKNFGFYFNFSGTCIGYSKNLDFMEYMAKNKNINFAILDEKITDVERAENLKVRSCLGLLNNDLPKGSFESVGENRITEFVLYGWRFKKEK